MSGRNQFLLGVLIALILLALMCLVVPVKRVGEVHQTNELIWKSYVYWQRAQGERKTIKMPGKKVWVFGGSAVWGTGVEWNETIPSYLAKYGYDVTNYGETGYVSTQELILLIQELKTDKPDIVIFYDGFNDTFSAYQQGVAGLPMNEFNRVKEFNLSKKWIGAYLKAKFQSQEYNLNIDCVPDVLLNYLGNTFIAKQLARSIGFDFYCFWQDHNYDDNEFFNSVYSIADGQKMVLNMQEKYFIDQCHLIKEGNKEIAARIYDHINKSGK